MVMSVKQAVDAMSISPVDFRCARQVRTFCTDRDVSAASEASDVTTEPRLMTRPFQRRSR